MNEWFIWLLFGHLFGDYMFQSDWMALNKKSNNVALMLHCIIYTTIVCMFISLAEYELSTYQVIAIFASHILIDGTDIVDKWCDMYGVRTWYTYLPRVGKAISISEKATIENIITTSFGAIVYVVVDNTLHLFMMFLILKYPVQF